MRTLKLAWLVGLGAAASVSAGSLAADKFDSPEAPFATPAGITLIDVTKLTISSIPQLLWRRLGDAQGKPLYTFDQDIQPGSATCLDECAKEFPPFTAPAHAKASGDWSIISRSDHLKQWAYQGRPLYLYSGQDPDGEPVAPLNYAEDAAWTDPSSKTYSPKAEWRRAAYSPEKTLSLPADFQLQALGIANGFGLVETATGRTIYAAKTSSTLSAAWRPVYAGAIARPSGEFGIVARKDGNRQWTYRGKSLYTFKEDYAAGEVNGIFASREVHAALVYRNFIPTSITVRQFPLRGPLLTTADGWTLYTQARYAVQYGGRETRTGYLISYNESKSLAARGCVAECTQLWKPMLAPGDAQSWGFWEVMDRPDGAKQWAFKGSPLYTYAGDKVAGDMEGNNRHEIIYGDAAGKISLAVVAGEPPRPEHEAGAGYYWHTAGVFY